MTVTLNHTIVHAKDSGATARFLTEMLGLPAPRKLGHFVVVEVGPTCLDILRTDATMSSRHFAFLVSEEEFDAIFDRLQARRVPYWADPFHQEADRINHWDDGRGVYFDDPNGHLIEVITPPYGGGLTARHVNPLLTR